MAVKENTTITKKEAEAVALPTKAAATDFVRSSKKQQNVSLFWCPLPSSTFKTRYLFFFFSSFPFQFISLT